MNVKKDMNEWRADRLGYVYFSRLKDLIINEPNDQLFDYWIDISENHKPTGRLFVVEVKSFDNDSLKRTDLVPVEFENLRFPALLVLFDNNNDHGYYAWIKKPEKNGGLRFNPVKDVAELNNDSLNTIVTEIKDWYSRKQIA